MTDLRKLTLKMKNISIVLSSFLTLISCNSNPVKPKVYAAKYTIVYDSIMTKLPGRFQIKDNLFIWQDGYAKDSFLHVVNLDTKSEILKTGKIGRGPGEFVTPNIGLCTNGNLFVHDMNGHHQAYFSFDSCLYGQVIIKPTSVPHRESIRKISIGQDSLFSLSPDKTPFLFFETPDTVIQFGETPFDKIKKYNNGYDINQGTIVYNQDKEFLIYATFDYPFIAIYKKTNLKFHLVKKIEEAFEYEISNEVVRIQDSGKGIFALALTKNYIIAQRYNYFNEDQIKETENVQKRPTTLFLYDYDGILIKIVDFGLPLIRIHASVSDDVIFAIIEDPDYVLINCKL
jgi:hypothetical protein